MDEMLERLKKYGADVEGAMGRFLGDVELYKTCFAVFLADEAFPKLREALLVSDYEKAFEYAHTLKGITGNMGITPLYQVISTMVEKLRKREDAGLWDDYAEIVKQLSKLEKINQL